MSASVVISETTVAPPGPPPMVGEYTSTPPVNRTTSVARIAELSNRKSLGIIVVIVSPAIPAETLAGFRRSCDFWTVVNVSPVMVAPTIKVLEKLVALVIVTLARFVPDKSTSVKSADDRLHAGPTINPPRSWKSGVGRATATAAWAWDGETICPDRRPVKVAPVKVAPEMSAAARLAFVRLALAKLALVSVVLARLTPVRFLLARATAGPTMNPPRRV